MNTKFFLILAMTASLAGPANADDVDASAVTTFQDGTPALAGEVNGNFQALIDAINDNASRLAALEAASGSDDSVAGHVFALRQMGITNRGQETTLGTTANLSQAYTVTFNADGSVTFVGEENEAELVIPGFKLAIHSNGAAVDAAGTYSQSGSNISTDLGVNFFVSADGNVIVASQFSVGTDVDNADIAVAESSFLVGVRID